ncbi:MAG: hypothetical protein H0W16_07660 [Actinobacteria bacterium]|nr:hypothetical protein [Actinomycetota bacterium]
MTRATTSITSIAVVSIALLAGCSGGGDTPSTVDSTDAAPTTQPETTTPPTTSTEPATTESSPTPTTPRRPRTIVIVVDQGRPRGGIKRPTFERGEKVVLVVRSDIGESVHLHGYDVDRPLTPGKPLRIALTANVAGRFEVELHAPDSLLAVLEVRP